MIKLPIRLPAAHSAIDQDHVNVWYDAIPKTITLAIEC